MSKIQTPSIISSTGTSHILSAREITLCGMFAAILTIISQISLPMPTGVPITIQLFGIALTGAVLGWRLGLLATLTYIALGAVGLPVFSNFRGGLSLLTGLTGGYIWAWPFLTVLSGIQPNTGRRHLNLFLTILSSLVGLALVELIGGLQWAALAGDTTITAILAYSFIAFIPKDIILTILAVIIGLPLRKRFACQ